MRADVKGKLEKEVRGGSIKAPLGVLCSDAVAEPKSLRLRIWSRCTLFALTAKTAPFLIEQS